MRPVPVEPEPAADPAAHAPIEGEEQRYAAATSLHGELFAHGEQVDAGALGVWRSAGPAHTIDADAAVCSLHGLPARPGHVLLAELEAHVVNDDKPLWRLAWRRLAAQAAQPAHSRAEPAQARVDIVYRVHDPAGPLRWVRLRGCRLPGLGLRPSLIGVCVDVSHGRRLEAAEQACELARRANRAKSEFLVRMNHELRTPLSGVLGFAQLLLMDPREPLSDGQRKKLELLETSARHLLRLTEDAVDMARLDCGRISLNMEPVDLMQLVKVCAAEARAGARHARVRIDEPAADAPPVWAWCDATRARQVVVNLLSNAVKYNRPTGTVSINVAIDVEGMVRLVVADSGLGMTADQLGRLYRPFERLGRETGQVPGSGVGLALARSMVEAMGGRIEVESEPDQGTRFTVCLASTTSTPDGPRAPLHGTHDTAIGRDPGTRGEVLLVEDQPANVSLLRAMLELRPGVRLRTAGSGAAALLKLRDATPDLLLVDRRLPDVDGLALVEHVRQWPAMKPVPIVCVSADLSPDTLERARAVGCAAFWSKPLNVAWVLADLDRLLSHRR